MRDNVAVAWRRAIFVLLAAVLALGALPSQALAEMAEEAMGEEPVAAQAEGPGEARAEGLVAQGTATLGGPEVAGDPAGVAGGEPGLSTQSVGRLYGPRVVERTGTQSGQVVTWDCVWLGSYPQTEVQESDALVAADWQDGDATVDGVRYRRIAKSDATYSDYWSGDGHGSAAYRYFRYEPIKWRILKVDGGTALAVADVALDCRRYHGSNTEVTWGASAVRSWLNGTGDAPYYTSGAQSGRTAQAFAEVAFDTDQLGAVRESEIANAANTQFGTSGGDATTDRVFLLSEAEVHGDSATEHGFVSSCETYDEARRCRPSDFARAMGAGVSTSGSYAGNCFWLLRSPGHYASYAACVHYDGYVSRGGYGVGNYYAVRPALNLDLSSPHLAWAGTVSSDGTVDANARPGSVKPFPDVPADSWCSGVVYRAATLGLMGGYDDGSFGPEDPITRGQAAVVLWNMADAPGAGAGARDFPDVSDEGAYHYNAVRWASSAGVVSGYENGRFGPDDNVTREQLAAMLANYARNVAGLAVEGTAEDYAGMGDGGDVSPWAVSSVGWCFGSGILSGTGDGNILPKGSATRAEAAKMLVGLYDLLGH